MEYDTHNKMLTMETKLLHVLGNESEDTLRNPHQYLQKSAVFF